MKTDMFWNEQLPLDLTSIFSKVTLVDHLVDFEKLI